MARALAVVVLFASCFLTPLCVNAGLAETLANSLGSLQTITIYEWPRPPQPDLDELLFIDPFASTIGAGVFGSGPSFDYNAETGGVSISAPPLLGKADEFGVREKYTPTSIKIHSGGNFASLFTPPTIHIYEQNTVDYPLLRSLTQPPPEPLSNDSPSFVEPYYSPKSDFSYYGNRIVVSLGSSSRVGAGTADFGVLLQPGLSPDAFFDVANMPGGASWAYDADSYFFDPNYQSTLAVVSYRRVGTSYSSDYIQGLPGNFNLLVVPSAAPEPSGVYLVATIGLLCLLPRFFSPRVAQRHRAVEGRLARF